MANSLAVPINYRDDFNGNYLKLFIEIIMLYLIIADAETCKLLLQSLSLYKSFFSTFLLIKDATIMPPRGRGDPPQGRLADADWCRMAAALVESDS